MTTRPVTLTSEGAIVLVSPAPLLRVILPLPSTMSSSKVKLMLAAIPTSAALSAGLDDCNIGAIVSGAGMPPEGSVTVWSLNCRNSKPLS